MIGLLAIGLLVMIICLAFQAAAAAAALRHFATVAGRPLGPHPRVYVFRQFAALMLLLMAGNLLQILVWALLYMLLAVFPDAETALYFSGVTFTSLGYGDVVLSPDYRLLAPIQAANGLIMFGISTALLYAAVQSVIVKLPRPPEKPRRPDTPA